MKINLAFSDKLPTAKTGQTKSGGMGKRSPLQVPEMGATGRAMSAAGRVAGNIGKRMFVAEQQRETLQAYTDTVKGYNNLYAELKKPEYQNMSVKEHDEWFNTKADTLKQGVLGNMKNNKAREAFGTKFDAETSREKIKTDTLAWNREVDRGEKTFVEARDTLEQEVAKGNWEAIGAFEAAAKGAADAGYISQAKAYDEVDKFSNRATMTYWERRSDDFQETTFDEVFTKSRTKKGFPVRGKKGLFIVKDKLPESFDNLDEEQKRNTLKYIKKGWEDFHSRMEWGNKKRKLVLNDDMKNDLARIKETGAGDKQIKDKISAAWGEDPDAMEQVLEIHNRNQRLASTTYMFTDKIMKASPQEEADIMESLEAHTNKDDPFIEGLSDWRRAELVSNLQQAKAQKSKALASDPANYVNKVYGADMALMAPQDATAFSLTEQARLGVPEYNRRVLSVPQAKAAVGSIMEMSGDQISGALDNLRANAGPYWDTVYKDLVREKLPVDVQLITVMDPVKDPILRQQMGEAMKVDPKKLKEDLGTEANQIVKDINAEVEEGLAGFYQAVLKGNNSAERKDLLRAIKTSVTNTAMLKIANGEKTGDAVDELVTAIIGDNYQNVKLHDGVNLIPKQVGGEILDPTVVSRNLNLIHGQMDNMNFIMEPNPNPNVADDVYRNRYVAQLKNKGYWALNPDMTGVIYYNGVSGLPVLEKTENGPVLFERKFLDLEVAKPLKLDDWGKMTLNDIRERALQGKK